MKKLTKRSKKGFTLAELLIVVAIIAILVAIAIPTFNSSLNKAKQAADDANIRAAYAQYTITTMLAAGTTDADPVADADDVKDAFAEIGVDALQYYSGITVPSNGSQWQGTTEDGGLAIK